MIRLLRRLKAGACTLYLWLFFRTPVPPRKLVPHLSPFRFIDSGHRSLQLCKKVIGLKPHEQVLEIGCGTGRLAAPLSLYLSQGHYTGVDVSAPSIQWAQENLAPLRRNCRFLHLDVRNGMYHPAGAQQAATCRLPFPDESFDLVILFSVFTHMRPEDVRGYLHQICRLLKKDGRCLATFFLINPESSRLMGQNKEKRPWPQEFPHSVDGFYTVDPDRPERAVAYDEQKVRRWFETSALSIQEPVRFGKWSGRKDGFSFQDIVLAVKRS